MIICVSICKYACVYECIYTYIYLFTSCFMGHQDLLSFVVNIDLGFISVNVYLLGQ